MEILAINGSPRKKWNTAEILQNVLDGAAEATSDALTEMIHLYDLKYHGCVSCFECKRLGGPSYGKCAVKDELQPVLQRALHADVLVFGSPIYFSDVTGEMRCFLERLLFPCFVYDKDYTSLAPKKLKSAFIYTMNVPESAMAEMNYPQRLGVMEGFASHIFGHETKRLYVNNTYQFKDYAKYASTLFDPEAKAKHRKDHFPIDCQNARKLGAELATR